MSILKAGHVLQELDALDHKRAEMLYVLAVMCAKRGYDRMARGCAEECILLMRRIGQDTYEECATSTPCCVGGIMLPEFLHEGVVRERLGAFRIRITV